MLLNAAAQRTGPHALAVWELVEGTGPCPLMPLGRCSGWLDAPCTDAGGCLRTCTCDKRLSPCTIQDYTHAACTMPTSCVISGRMAVFPARELLLSRCTLFTKSVGAGNIHHDGCQTDVWITRSIPNFNFVVCTCLLKSFCATMSVGPLQKNPGKDTSFSSKETLEGPLLLTCFL